MGAVETVAALLGSSVVSSAITAIVARRGQQEDTLQLSEVKFRKSLIHRIEQLERRADADAVRIRELEREVIDLRGENDRLRQQAGQRLDG